MQCLQCLLLTPSVYLSASSPLADASNASAALGVQATSMFYTVHNSAAFSSQCLRPAECLEPAWCPHEAEAIFVGAAQAAVAGLDLIVATGGLTAQPATMVPAATTMVVPTLALDGVLMVAKVMNSKPLPL